MQASADDVIRPCQIDVMINAWTPPHLTLWRRLNGYDKSPPKGASFGLRVLVLTRILIQ